MMQPLPCHHVTKEVLSEQQAAEVDPSGNNPRLSRGYVSDDPWGPPQEARMASTTPEAIPASTWVTDNKLKWTALERMFRGEKAKRLTAEVYTTWDLLQLSGYNACMSVCGSGRPAYIGGTA